MKHITVLLAALVLVLGAHAVTRADSPAAAPAGVQKWEYRIEGPTVKMLRTRGAEGWELVTVTPVGDGDDRVCYLKRPLK